MSKRTVTFEPADVEEVKAAASEIIAEAVAEEFARAGDTGQLAMSLCATCGHSQSPDHPADGVCVVSWFDSDKVQQFCRCAEFWPWRPQYEDSWRVLEHEVALGGSVGLELDRRATAELWGSLLPGRSVTLTVVLQVGGKGFKAVRDKGVMVGLAEYRKLSAERLVWSFDEVDEETGELR